MMALVLTSCSNEDELEILQLDKPEFVTIKVKYKDKTYEVPCKYENDSLMYLDEEFNNIYKNEISKIPEVAALLSKDENGNDVISYYSDYKELEISNGFDILQADSSVVSRVGTGMQPTAGRVILYDDTNFKDRTVVLDLDLRGYYYIRYLLEGYKFNDKTSAIRVFNFLRPGEYYSCAFGTLCAYGRELRVCMIGYEHSFHEGKRLYCVAEYVPGQDINKPNTASHQDYKLRSIGWNDKLSSVELKIIRAKEISSGAITPHKPCK